MKNYKSILSIVLLGTLTTALTGCRDDLKDPNIPPSEVTDARASQLFTTAQLGFSPFDYGVWFHTADNYLKNCQMCGFSGSMTEDRLAKSGQTLGLMSTELLRYYNEMVDKFGEDGGDNACYLKAVQVLAIFGGIRDTDNNGDIPYTEAASYIYGGPMTPKYDKVQELYTLWNSQLKAAVQVFKNPPSPEGGYENNQDLAYKCDWSKWAKLASSLRVKLATRLIHRDLALAKTIVAEAVADGVMTSTDDDLLFSKADTNWGEGVPYDRGDLAFGTGNTTITYQGIVGSKKVVDYMVENGDPRVRFFLTKNDWNSDIVDYYLRNGYASAIPPVIMEMVETEEVDGKTVFKNWKGKGEPWVRYIGVPDGANANSSTEVSDRQYFGYNGTQGQPGANTIVVDGTTYSYRPYSNFNEQLLSQRADKNFPRVPGGEVIVDRDDNPRYDMYMTAAEVNFYLAEFATYGGVTGLGNASDYFRTAVQQSVESWDKYARLSKLPYYGDTRNVSAHEEVIDLKPNEVSDLLSQPKYQLTGNKADDLEKIFLNLEFHFMFNPLDQFVTGRRSGIPKFNSSLFPRTDYTAAGYPADGFNRRGYFSPVSPTDLMKDIIEAAYVSQGFSTAATGTGNYLNTERLWQDVGAPQWGAGPNKSY